MRALRLVRSDGCGKLMAPPGYDMRAKQQIGVIYGSPETTSGGNALKFYSSVRIDIRRISTIKGNDGEDVGIRAKVRSSSLPHHRNPHHLGRLPPESDYCC